jgi:hypothetical protein
MSLIGRIRASWTRIGAVMLATGAVTGFAALSGPATAAASSNQWGMFEIPNLQTTPAGGGDTASNLQTLRSLGVSIVRVYVAWNSIAPNSDSRSRPGFAAWDPNSYPAGNWAPLDNLVNQASARGISVDLMPTSPAPLWAVASGAPGCGTVGGFPVCFTNSFMPSASEYGQFVRALATRYSNVHFWELWNEANWGPSLTPQYYGSSLPTSAKMYRGLLNAGWNGLQQAGGHSRDTIVASSLSQDGSARVGQTGTTAPLTLIRTVYCLSSSFGRLGSGVASQMGCPTSKRAYNRFRGANPALFRATGWGVHPYAYGKPPTKADFPNPNGAEFAEIPNMIRTLDRTNRFYGSRKAMIVYNTEYGYQPIFVSASNAAKYINWGEFLSYKNPRIGSYDNYELQDTTGFFQTGLISVNGVPKPSFDAYRMPVWLPVTTTRRGKTLEVWGAARPAEFARRATGRTQYAYIQLNGRTIKAVKITNGRGYFDVRVKFPGSGQVRIAWQYPSDAPSMTSPYAAAGQTIYSRTTGISIR